MRKNKAIRLLSGTLAALTLFGGFSIVSAADTSPASSYDLHDLGGLTDVLSTIKYAEYLQRHGDPSQYDLTGVGTLEVDVVKDYSPENTSALCRKDVITGEICTKENLEKFFDPDRAVFEVDGKEYKVVDFLSDLESYRNRNEDGTLKKGSNSGISDNAVIVGYVPGNTESGTVVSSIKIKDSFYTEKALRLLNPKDYHDANPMKYPTIALTEEEEEDLAMLETIQDLLSDLSQKFVTVYEKNPYEDPDGGSEKAIYLPDHDAVGFKINVEKSGYYNIYLRYFSINEDGVSKKTSIERSIYIDGAIPFYESTYVSISKTYRSYVEDGEGNKLYGSNIQNGDDRGFATDINGNEIRPSAEMTEAWRTIALMDSTGSHVEPLKFYLSEGEHVLQFFARREPMVLSAIRLEPVSEVQSYEDYLKKYSGKTNVTAEDIGTESGYIKIEAEYPDAVSDNTIYATNDRTSQATSPQHPSIQYLNTLGGAGSGDQKKWSTVGQWVRYRVVVPKSGFYKIALRFSQTTLQGSYVSRQLRVQLNSELGSETGATVPFQEAYYLQFPYGDDWQVSYLNRDGVEYSIYLEAGEEGNIIELEANLGDMSDVIRRVTESMNSVNDAYIKFLMLAGSSPDADRDYGFYRRIPDAVLTLSREASNIFKIADDIEKLTGTRGSHVATLEKVAQLLERMGSDEEEIAKNLDSLKSNLGTLGTWISDSKESPLEVDYLMIAPGDYENTGANKVNLPKPTPNFFEGLWFECKMFVASFTTDYNTLGLMEETDESAIVVWTTTGRDQANIIRSMVNNEFTKNTGIAVNLKLVAGGSLLPSVLAGVGPDVSMGHASADIINWAIRSALVELTDMGTREYCEANSLEYDPDYDAHIITGFDNVIADFNNEDQDTTVASNAWFNTAAMVPMSLHEVITKKSYEALADEEKAAYTEYGVKYYKDLTPAEYELVDKYDKKYYTATEVDGKTVYRYFITEKQYQALDAAEKKEYTRNETEYYEKFSLWGLPQEQTFNMMFYRADIFSELGITAPKTWEDLYSIIGVLQSNNMEIAMPTSLGGFEMFLYQMGGNLYSNGGQTISLDENLSIEAFETLCNFFQSYKFPITVDFSNRFRTGEIPMGIIAYTSYTQLSVFATEIKGMWEFVPLPGVRDSVTGEINNVATSSSSGIIMLKGARDREVTFNSWKFMVWFTGKSAQSTYASEVTAVLGTESKHNTANKEALKELPWTSSERDNLLSQFDSLVGIPEYPGGYIISRYVNFAFLDVYNNNADPVVAIQEYVVTINSELTRKRKEFHLATMED